VFSQAWLVVTGTPIFPIPIPSPSNI